MECSNIHLFSDNRKQSVSCMQYEQNSKKHCVRRLLLQIQMKLNPPGFVSWQQVSNAKQIRLWQNKGVLFVAFFGQTDFFNGLWYIHHMFTMS